MTTATDTELATPNLYDPPAAPPTPGDGPPTFSVKVTSEAAFRTGVTIEASLSPADAERLRPDLYEAKMHHRRELEATRAAWFEGPEGQAYTKAVQDLNAAADAFTEAQQEVKRATKRALGDRETRERHSYLVAVLDKAADDLARVEVQATEQTPPGPIFRQRVEQAQRNLDEFEREHGMVFADLEPLQRSRDWAVDAFEKAKKVAADQLRQALNRRHRELIGSARERLAKANDALTAAVSEPAVGWLLASASSAACSEPNLVNNLANLDRTP